MAKSSTFPEELFDRYDALISTIKVLERKGATMPYTSVNGHMFSFIDKEGLLSLRLGKEDLAAFIKKYKTQNSVQHGAMMKEYALVPAALFKKTKELGPWFAKSFDYASSLKPKPTGR